ncbi:MAG: dTDP-4-dehydrorhamnose reductase [Chlorobi bacterium]|nr:dTDP-4-dehydrorhamnose reductase [Chlorobiota bacterium]
MRVAIVGAQGALGRKTTELISKETGWELVQLTRTTLDIDGHQSGFDSKHPTSWKALFESESLKPDVVINTAAFTNVDRCERERHEAWESNARLVEMIAKQCKRHDRHLVQISTDYIFDGKNGPYLEGAPPCPINYYGKTKLAAENICTGSGVHHTIIRTMWLYGDDGGTKPSFVSWVNGALSRGETIRVVNDEYGNPTLLEDLAYGIIKAVEREYLGIVNIAGPELMSRYEWACHVARVNDLDAAAIEMITDEELHRPARRPLRSGLVSLKAQAVMGLRLTPLNEGLQRIRIREARTAAESH